MTTGQFPPIAPQAPADEGVIPQPRRHRLGLALAAPLLLAAGTLSAGSSTVAIDLVSGTVTPAFPTVNILAADSIYVTISPADGRWRQQISGARDDDFTYGSSVTINFRKLKTDHAPMPPTLSGTAWTVYAAKRTVINLEIDLDTTIGDADLNELAKKFNHDWKGKDLKNAFKAKHAFPLQLETAGYELDWSAGFAFLDLVDERFRLDPILGDSANVQLVQLRDDKIPYRLAAFAHYCGAKARWLCWTFGLGTDVPVTGLTAIGGISARWRVIPIKDSMFFTAGVAYGPHKVLNSDFEGRSKVPVGTTTASLLSERYDFRLAVAVSFGFFGGEEEFKGVYEGKQGKQ
jgi:hypothetical protein